MSLYNALHGVEPTAGLALGLLGIKQSDVPRFRDSWITIIDDKPMIVIHTRTGGGNRDYYDNRANHKSYDNDPYEGPYNEDLRKLPGFINDEDCDFDQTYANFYFNVPQDHINAVKELVDILGIPRTPKEKFEELLNKLRKG